jgi:hypothetical protein
VLFSGEISPTAATLWAWVTNFKLSHERVQAIANLLRSSLLYVRIDPMLPSFGQIRFCSSA